MTSIIRLLFLALMFVVLFPQHSYADQDLERLQQLLSNGPSGISNNTWRAAVTNYLSSCRQGQCKCLLLVSEKKAASTHLMWAGKIAGSSTQEKFSTYGGMKATNAGGGGSGWDRSFNNSLPTCTTGNAIVSNGDAGDACCVSRGSSSVCSGKCRYYQNRADVLGIPKGRRNHRIYYRSTLSGVFYLHEEATKCNAPPCGRSFGCVRIYAEAMKDLCENHIGMTSAATGRAHAENGGAYLFFQNQQSIGADSLQQAAQGLAAYERKCGGFSISRFDNSSPVQRGYGRAYGRNDSPSRPSGSSPNSGGSNNFLAAFFFKMLFSGQSSTGPAAPNTGTYKELANQR